MKDKSIIQLLSDEIEKTAKELTAEGREHIKSKNFVFPKKEAYPIHDLSHARNALARVSQHGSPSEQATVKSKVYEKYPALKERHMEKESAAINFATGASKISNSIRQPVKPAIAKLTKLSEVRHAAFINELERLIS
jgi:hypothetical protein